MKKSFSLLTKIAAHSVAKTVAASLLAVLVSAIPTMASAKDKVVVYNWSEYIPEQLLKDFEKETGIEVVYSVYDSNESMYAKIKLLNGGGYDIVVPSGYYISKMSKEGLIDTIDHSKLANFKNLDPNLLNKNFDPNNAHSVPYLWGSTGIGINTETIPYDSIKSWKDLWDPKFKNSLLLLDDMRDIFHMALVQLGYSPNTTKEAEIKAAYELLSKLMPNVLTFNSDAPRMPFLAGEVNIGVLWNGEVSMAHAENSKIRYIYPSEGAVFWIDSFAIPSKAPHKEAAMKFIDFMLRPESAKACVEYVGYGTPNKTAVSLLAKEVQQDPTIFPSSDIIAKGDFNTDVGEATLVYEKYWEKLKAGR
jgi:spermidine/putrescine transport system substrate-binding protein